MFAKKIITTGLLASTLCSPTAFSNQASTEYVKAAVDALRSEISNITNQLSSRTSELIATTNQLTTNINTITIQIKDSGSNTNSKIEAVQNQVNELPIITHHIGELFQGGIIFYVDASRQHGLMASVNDLGQEGIEWRNGEGGDRTVNAQARGLGSGENNTRLIIAEQTIDQQEGVFAALLAANHQSLADGTPCPATISPTLTCYGGWYLPSIYELVLMHANLKNLGLGQLADEGYWSSTESNTTQAWLINFGTGEAVISEKSNPARVRAIHAF
jgi:hypothetical protein